ncbi:carboxymuconolactone decarboxylase family protein [Microbispora sp. CA-135349]|uniref:carboxymuconolactone decarboxylase family protein n=1 Tax=Microbispora sp. CA-135349 TaxID=3239953 RepID=UPI003D8B3E5C
MTAASTPSHNGSSAPPPEPETMLAAGDRVRRRVLGDEHVDRSRTRATPFGQPLQELVTEYCWGKIWTRPGLELRTRSLINIALLTALGKPDELKLHVRGAIRNGCSVEEIQEVLLQTAIYCGVPAALEASRNAQVALDGIDGE